MTGLVIGIGEALRGDDAVGPRVARAVAPLLPVGWAAEVHRSDLTALLDLWEGVEHVIVVDAVVSGAPVGTLHVLDGLRAEFPIALGGPSSHWLGLAEAVALGRALGRLPRRMEVVGIEGAAATLGSEPCAAVLARIPEAVAHVQRAALTSPAPLP